MAASSPTGCPYSISRRKRTAWCLSGADLSDWFRWAFTQGEIAGASDNWGTRVDFMVQGAFGRACKENSVDVRFLLELTPPLFVKVRQL